MALPTHRLSIFKRLGNEQWSNDWLLNVIDMDEGEAVSTALIEFERRLHMDIVTFEYYRLSTMTPGDRLFRHNPINQPGYIPQGAEHYLPLFNTVRLDMSTLDSDPLRKYFRLPVSEAWQTDGKLIPAQIANFDTLIVTYLMNTVAPDNVVSGRGNVMSGASIHPYVQMRQLHSRKKKKIVQL